MPAELALHRRVGHLAFLQLGQRAAELGHVGVGLGEVQVTAVGARAGILGTGLGQVFEFLAGLDLLDQRHGLFFLVDQDVAGAVLGAGGLGLELVVFTLGFGVGHGVLLAEVLEQLADQDALAGEFHLVAEVSAGGHAALFGFLHEDLAQHDLVACLLLNFGADLLAAALGLLDQHVDTRLRDGLAVHAGNVLGVSNHRQDCCQGQGQRHGQGRAGGRCLEDHGERTFVGGGGEGEGLD